jgi:4-hydroxythreonine-4-phosphate dehydrogenase
LLRTTRISVGLSAVHPPTDGRAADRVIAVDTHSRRQSPADAAASVRAAIAACGGVPILKKVDSLLRGNLAAEVGALRDLFGVVPIVATALPVAGRAVIDGVLRIDGVPLHETGLWHAEERPAPRSIAAALAPLETCSVPLATVRQGIEMLAKALAEADAAGRVAVCDAESDDDLDSVHAAARLVCERPVLVGSGALAAAAARAFPADGPELVAPARSVAESVLVVVGSAAPSLSVQLTAVETAADVVLRLDPHDLLRDPRGVRRDIAARVRGARCAVVSLDGAAGVRPELAPQLAAALAKAVEPAAADHRALVLTGGETARGVLDLLGIHRLTPVAERCGAVLSRAGDRLVATRPGSFGSPTSLADLVASLFTEPVPEEPT